MFKFYQIHTFQGLKLHFLVAELVLTPLHGRLKVSVDIRVTSWMASLYLLQLAFDGSLYLLLDGHAYRLTFF